VLRRLVSADPKLRRRVVVVSANTDDLSRADRCLAAHTLRKPFNLVDLIEAVDEVSARAAS
jgi:DNA-binding NarL/FixJ family response regulator